MNIEEAVNYLKENLKSWKDARPDLSNTDIVEEVDKDYKAIETLITAYEKENDNAQTILNLIEKLQKENEELKEKIREHTLLISPYYVKENFIPVQKVEDKIKKYKNMLKTCNKAKDIDRIKAINERILELQELLEGRK